MSTITRNRIWAVGFVTGRKAVLGLAVTCLLLGLGAAHAQNIRFLEYSPIRYFTDQDWGMARAAAKQALEADEEGAPVTWSNPETGNSGSSTALEGLEREGRQCRRLKIENLARGLSGQSAYLFCRQSDGEWKVESSTK